MRNFRSLVLGLVLVSLAGVSWGEEDLVFYCVEEYDMSVQSIVNGKYEYISGWSAVGTGELRSVPKSLGRFQFKWDGKREGEIAITGDDWTGPEESSYVLKCDACWSSYQHDGTTYPMQLMASNNIANFNLTRKNFFYADASRDSASLRAGTCTKF